jgi:ATP-binding cassette subfamily B (MDR/TAP) protein 1
MGHVAAAFTETGGSTPDNIIGTMSKIAAIVMMIAMLLFIFSYIFFAFYQHLAERICLDLRKRYISALMRQEVGYFEINKVEQIPAQISEIFETVKSSIGEKIANFIFAISTCISGMIYALCYGPTFAVVCIAYLPVLIAIVGIFGLMVRKSSLAKLEVVKQLGGIAEETLTAIKVVAGFTREDRELAKFQRYSENTMIVGKKASATMAMMVGLMKFSIFFFYTYSLLIGSIFIVKKIPNSVHDGEPYNQQIVLQTLIALITGFVGLIAALPNVQAIVAAKTLGVLIFDVIERVPEVRNAPGAITQLNLEKEITFNNVTFKYPTSMPEHKPVLINASFSIKAVSTTAIVGPSGSGKSTIVQLIERFYDPRIAG